MLDFIFVISIWVVLVVVGLGVRKPNRSVLLKRAALLGLVLAPLTLGAAWKLINSRTFQLSGEIVSRVDTAEKVVALTFDDGPTAAYTSQVLEILRRSHTKATFFVTGRELEENPAAGKQIVTEGHQLGNHSYSHERMVGKSYQFVRSELERTDALIKATCYQGAIHFRPPFGKKLLVLPLALSQRGQKTITWDVEPDSSPQSASMIVAKTLKRVRPGSIILLHAMVSSRATSREAVPKIIRILKEQGYRFVTVSELLETK
ncbi:polysaccharide deacetylase [bacterium]|nr:MAG: polysaccharide deacetylase [bacterium]